MAAQEQVWDPPSIKAEVERRGSTLSEISRKAGLFEAAARLGIRGGSYAGAKAVAAWLQIPFETLFPNMYLSRRAREEGIRDSSVPASRNRARRADAARAS